MGGWQSLRILLCWMVTFGPNGGVRSSRIPVSHCFKALLTDRYQEKHSSRPASRFTLRASRSDASTLHGIDSALTLSIPRNSLPLNMFHRHLLKHFDTLSVNRGARVSETRL